MDRLRHAGVGAFAAWLTAFAMCVPIAGTFLWAMFDSKSFDRFVRRRNRKEYNGYWRKYEWFQGILGFVDDSGENPFQVLGVSQSATAAQIRKRFRDLSVKYHPDKTGNDPVKSAYFVKLQRAMEAMAEGKAKAAAKAALDAKEDEVAALSQAMAEGDAAVRLRVARC